MECGAGTGELTKQLASLLDVYDFKLTVINDSLIENMDSRIIWKTGLSYEVLKEFMPSSIDFCIIDTDHNYWTLMKEFEALFDRISEGGLLALHDVETFYHDTGMAMDYGTDKPYPKEEILKFAAYGSLGDALIDFLHLKKLRYRLLYFTPESQGAALIQRKTQLEYAVVVPGSNPMYAKKKSDEIPIGV